MEWERALELEAQLRELWLTAAVAAVVGVERKRVLAVTELQEEEEEEEVKRILRRQQQQQQR